MAVRPLFIPRLWRLVYSVLAVMLMSSWSDGIDDPVEFTVEVFPPTEGPPVVPDEQEVAPKEEQETSVETEEDITTETTTTTKSTTTSLPTTTTTIPSTTTKTTKIPTSTTLSTTSASRMVRTTTTGTTKLTTLETTTPLTTTTTTTTKDTTTSTAIPTTLSTTTEDPGHCSPDPYCDGSSFPAEFYISKHKVVCDQRPQVSQHCCLPQGKHLVCYNIVVDGEYLTFAADSPAVSTDFMELCDLLLLSQNATAGPYSTISKVKGSGRLAYRYKEWVTLKPSIYRVKDIACMVRVVRRRKPMKKARKPVNKENKIKKDNSTSQEEHNEISVDD